MEPGKRATLQRRNKSGASNHESRSPRAKWPDLSRLRLCGDRCWGSLFWVCLRSSRRCFTLTPHLRRMSTFRLIAYDVFGEFWSYWGDGDGALRKTERRVSAYDASLLGPRQLLLWITTLPRQDALRNFISKYHTSRVCSMHRFSESSSG